MVRRRHLAPQQPAYRDALFMESVPARPVRILSEYLDPWRACGMALESPTPS